MKQQEQHRFPALFSVIMPRLGQIVKKEIGKDVWRVNNEN